MTAPLRRLGFGEARMHLMQQMLHGTTQGALAVRVAGPLDVEHLHDAVREVRKAHLMLRLTIREQESEYYYFAQPPEADAQVELRAPAPYGDGMAQLEAENGVPLDAAERTWRIAVQPYINAGELPVHDLILVMHHAIMDAGGSDYLLHEVLTRLAGEGTPAAALSDPPEPIAPTAESACLVATDWDAFSATQQEIARRTLQVNPPAHRTAAPHAERRTVGQAFKLDRRAVAALSAHCAAAGVTLNSFISAALLAAVRACDPSRSEIALYTAVSLRRLCPSAAEARFGCYLSVVPTFHRLDDAPDLAELAREHQGALQAAFIQYGKPPRDYTGATLAAAIQGVANIDRFVNDIGFTYAESSLQPRYGALRLLHSHVLSNRAAGNVALVLHGLKQNEEVFFTLIHTQPLQEAAFAQAVAARLQTMLGNVRSGGSAADLTFLSTTE